LLNAVYKPLKIAHIFLGVADEYDMALEENLDGSHEHWVKEPLLTVPTVSLSNRQESTNVKRTHGSERIVW
jgi:hypothetical protein